MSMSISAAEKLVQPELATWPSGSRLKHNPVLSVRGRQVFLVEGPEGETTGTITVDPDGEVCTCKKIPVESSRR
jgi:hypothetical protein